VPQAYQSSTTTALLEGLKDTANEAIWREFDARYRPILFAFARRLGLDNEDAVEVAQDTMAKFVEAYLAGAYDRERGHLRSWLIAILRNCVVDLWRRRARRRERRGDSAIVDFPGESDATRIWELERKGFVLRQSLAELRQQGRFEPRTLDAFELLVVHGTEAGRVATQLGMKVHDVHVAKHRVADRLHTIVARWEAMFSEE